MKNILFVASEAVPFIKTGGLADVVGSLPKYFDRRYFDCRVIIPKYLCIRDDLRNKLEYVNHFYMASSNTFTRDRTVEHIWDEYAGKFFPAHGIAVRKI